MITMSKETRIVIGICHACIKPYSYTIDEKYEITGGEDEHVILEAIKHSCPHCGVHLGNTVINEIDNKKIEITEVEIAETIEPT